MDSPQEAAAGFLSRHGLTPPVSYEGLLDACGAEGICVTLTLRPLECRAVCVTGGKRPVIILSPGVAASAWVLAHEISHALVEDSPPGLWASAFTGEEAWAEEFAALLLAPNPH